MADPGEFLARWSRLKRKASADAREAAPARPPATAEPPPPEPPACAEATVASGAAQSELPPIDTLGRDSDYTPFMRADVPDGLRNEALRKLWQSDPVFANLDGLLEYGEDFATAFSLGGAVATVYRVLEGMPRQAAPQETQPAAHGSATVAEPGRGSAAGPTTPAEAVESSEGAENIELERGADVD